MTIPEMHRQILDSIIAKSGKPTKHTFQDGYLGNSNPRYPINNPSLRSVARDFMKENKGLTSEQVRRLCGSLIHGKSSTEKNFAGIILDRASQTQRAFDPICFEEWLDHLTGWAEIDSVCSGKYSKTEVPKNLAVWKKILSRLSKSRNINKRRASLVFLCSPARVEENVPLATFAFRQVDSLCSEKEILITKAISWLLRSLIKHHKKLVADYIKRNSGKLPAIAVRETMTKLRTGRKTKKLES
jgi:3-methyladenine DNA glycosylase AlkD